MTPLDSTPAASSSEAIRAGTVMVEAVNLSKRYGLDRMALDHLNLEIRAGQLYALLGAHGFGKSTAINLFVAFARPTSGRAVVAGLDVAESAVEAKRQISYISARGSLYGNMTARKNIEFFTAVSTSRVVGRTAAYDAMRQFGVPERAFETKVDRVPRELRLLLWLAIAFLRETPILMLDEPTAGLDSKASADLQEHLLDFKRQGKAILLATADVFLATRVSDRIGILKDGQKVAERTRTQMLGQSLNELYFDYVGRPPTTGISRNGPVKDSPA